MLTETSVNISGPGIPSQGCSWTTATHELQPPCNRRYYQACCTQTCLELALKTSHTGSGVPPTEVLYGPPQVTGPYLSVSTGDGLQNGIVDENVLLLGVGTERRGKDRVKTRGVWGCLESGNNSNYGALRYTHIKTTYTHTCPL